MSGYFIPRGWCRPVQFELEERCSAVRELLRPDEVQHLWNPGSPSLSGPSIVEQVERHYSEQFAAGALRYEHDPIRVDCWCSPARTLERGYGDCDDLAILAASTLIAGGVNASVVIGSVGGGTGANHAWVEGTDEHGRGFFYESTDPAVWYGARPLSYAPHALVDKNECVDLRPRRRHVDWAQLLAQGAVVVGTGLLAATLVDE